MVCGKSARLLLLFILIFNLVDSVINTNIYSDIVEIFVNVNETSAFNHLIVDKNTGVVFVGATNKLYQFTPELYLTKSIVTGPKNDSTNCPAGFCHHGEVKTLMDNVNKALLIDYSTGKLISCGSVSHGICSVMKVNDILDAEDFQISVAASDASSSTVAFIAPGPSGKPVMYVGATYNDNAQDPIPAVCSRSLEDGRMFEIVKDDVSVGTKLSVNSHNLKTYLIKYVYGFTSRRFSYFLTVQMADEYKKKYLISKIVRLCNEDEDFNSYTEIPFKCSGKDGRFYDIIEAAYIGKVDPFLAKRLEITTKDDVLFAIFSQKQKTFSYTQSEGVSLCIYSLKSIERKFLKNIERCFRGDGKKGFGYVSLSVNCINTTMKIDDNFCQSDANKNIDGAMPMNANSVYAFNNKITSVAATAIGNHTIVFVGTSRGHIKKIAVDQWLNGIEYDDVVIEEGFEVHTDLQFDPELKYLYAMTQNRISKVRLQKCKTYTTCNACLNSKDPFCGWCSNENKCTLYSECKDAFENRLSWIPYVAPYCPVIVAVKPNMIQRSTSENLKILVQNTPLFSGVYMCAFSIPKFTFVTNAKRTINEINCDTPKIESGFSFDHNYTVKLALKVDNGPDIAITDFTFYDCSSFESCTDCISLFPCDWCIYENRCTHDSSKQFCKNDTAMSIVNIKSSLAVHLEDDSVSSCPIITAISGTSNQILIPSNVKKSVEVNAQSMSIISNYTDILHCHFESGKDSITVKAMLLYDIVSCEPKELIYASQTPNITMNFSVTWNGYKTIDNKDNFHVVVFKCKHMADSCGLCLDIESKYGCGWCQTSKSCEVYEHCDEDVIDNWLNSSDICPNPEIHSFHPLTGLIDADSMITIKGINLGQIMGEYASIVEIAGEECQPVSSDSIQIKCSVNKLANQLPKEGPIIVQVGNYSSESKINFSFVSPVIESFSPTFGPKSGKTVLKIFGQHLNAGNHMQVFLNEKPCEILSNSEEEVVCRSNYSNQETAGNLTMNFDGAVREYDILFRYVDDPEIISCLDTEVSSQHLTLKGIVSGGIDIHVSGKNLNSVFSPKMIVYFDDEMFYGDCNVMSNITMTCESPSVSTVEQELDPENPLKLDFGFNMDEVESVKNLSSEEKYEQFWLYPDPVYEKFNEEVKYMKSEYLTIQGRHLDMVCEDTDVEVTIGGSICKITSLSRYHLICQPPSEENMTIDGEEVFDVAVKVGHKMEFSIGKVSYSSQGNGIIIISVVTTIVVLITVFLLFIFIYKKKSTESIRNLKKMEARMDKLELRVAAECKEAFAELQTEMVDLTGDLSECIPFLDYRTYAMNVLFPNSDNYGILQWRMPESTKYEKGLSAFHQLLMNKTFLLNLIDTLESNKYFTMTDRVTTASLLMIILQNEMEYCTEILKILLSKLIEKSVKGKCHPKLLLRRTDSIAEKMLSSWLTFLLYTFLKDCAGEPLYKLFRSVKGQLDKGPIDVITSEAKYSLSEGKLLREFVDFTPMCVYVFFPLSMRNSIIMESDIDDIPIKVLDCDTISQVKEKCIDTIYKAKPYSQRPCKEDFDLEWKTGSRVRLILHDEDNTNQLEDDWKKLNTLKHYKVPNGANMVLVSKQDSIDKFSTIKSLNYDTLKRKVLKSESSPAKLWHLVKPQDDDVHKESERENKMVSEVYLTRLLATKGTLQKFVDDLLETIFNGNNKKFALPFAIKYIFDFLDQQATLHEISDPEVVHTWKNNSLPLRFWVNLIKNPNFIFDIQKSNTVDGCLSVIAQTFMDSCSTAEHILGKDSPSSKLLYAKDIPMYKEWVKDYYVSIKNMAAISDQDMNAFLAEESRSHTEEFNTNFALQEVYSYVLKYSEQLRVTLEEDEASQKSRLAQKLNQVHSLMDANFSM